MDNRNVNKPNINKTKTNKRNSAKSQSDFIKFMVLTDLQAYLFSSNVWYILMMNSDDKKIKTRNQKY